MLLDTVTAPFFDILDVYCGNVSYEHLNKCLFTPDRAEQRTTLSTPSLVNHWAY